MTLIVTVLFCVLQLKDWADVILVAPMSANTLGKLANGLANNLLVCC